MNYWSDGLWGRLANYVTAFVSAILLAINVTVVSEEEKSAVPDNYELVFEDEFEGEKLDTTKWTYHGKAQRKGGYWDAGQVTVKDGNLVIHTEYKEDGKYGSGWYTGAVQATKKHEYSFGYYECRCKLPYGQGMWSAFWLMNGKVNNVSGTGIYGTEIDIFESPYSFLPGKSSWKVTSNLHYNGYELKTKYQNVCISSIPFNPYECYNTYGLLWTEDEYVFYVNGNEVGRSSFGGVSKEKEHMILSCEIDGAAAEATYGWSGNMNMNDKTFTADFLVDYVRVYQAK